VLVGCFPPAREPRPEKGAYIKLRASTFALALVFSCGTSLAHAAKNPDACPADMVAVAGKCTPSKEVRAKIDGIVRASMVKQDLKAVLAGIAIDGKPLFISAWGQSMTGVPATPDMHFRNGAIAIAYMATVLLQLCDERVLSLDDKLSKWFPQYPKADRVTLQMLINATSGYADYVNEKILVPPLYANPFRAWTPDELIAMGLGQPTKCEPGTCWSYAHTNFVILGKVLEKATHRNLEDLIRERILDRLALKDTRSENTAIIQEPVLHAFDGERGHYEESTYWNPSWTLAHGAIMTSNIGDVLKSATAIGTGALLSPQSHALQLAPLTARFKRWNDKSYYGLGVVVANGWVIQTPSFAGYAAFMGYLPSHKLAIAVSNTLGEKVSLESNRSTDLAGEIAKYLAPDTPIRY
jgi:CubicO group peptidase (beta-lactamase class C family)